MSGIELSREYIPAIQWSTAIIPILDEGRNLKLSFEGLSMYPLLVGGRDEVIMTTINGKRLKRGDIVLYVRKDGTHVLHRIHGIKNNSYYMLGDAQTWIEGPIKKDAILAVVTAVIRKEKMILCKNLNYRLKSRFWVLVRPLRPLILRLIKGLRTILTLLLLLALISP